MRRHGVKATVTQNSNGPIVRQMTHQAAPAMTWKRRAEMEHANVAHGFIALAAGTTRAELRSTPKREARPHTFTICTDFILELNRSMSLSSLIPTKSRSGCGKASVRQRHRCS